LGAAAASAAAASEAAASGVAAILGAAETGAAAGDAGESCCSAVGAWQAYVVAVAGSKTLAGRAQVVDDWVAAAVSSRLEEVLRSAGTVTEAADRGAALTVDFVWISADEWEVAFREGEGREAPQ